MGRKFQSGAYAGSRADSSSLFPSMAPDAADLAGSESDSDGEGVRKLILFEQSEGQV